MECPEFGTRIEPEFVAQPRDELTIGLPCPGTLTGAYQRFHVETQCCFIERVVVQESSRLVDRLCGFQLAAQVLLSRTSPRGAQSIAFEAHPARPGLVGVVIEPDEQIAATQCQRIGHALLAQRLFEGVDVGARFEAQSAALHFDLLGAGQ